MQQLKNGDYLMDVTLQGGSGRATITSPTKVSVNNDDIEATIEWSSKSYDYMEVDGVGYKPVNTEGNSTFVVKLSGLDADIPVKAETTAMSTPHLIDYTIKIDSATAKTAETSSAVAPVIIGGVSVVCVAVLLVTLVKKLGRGKNEN